MRKLYAAWRGHLMILLVMVAALLVLDATNQPYNPDLVGSPQQIGLLLVGAGLLVAAFFEWCRWYNRQRGVKVTLEPQDVRFGMHWPTFLNGIFLGAVFFSYSAWQEGGQDGLLGTCLLVAAVTVALAAVMAVVVRLLLSPSPALRLPRRRKARSTSPQPRPPAAAARPSSSE